MKQTRRELKLERKIEQAKAELKDTRARRKLKERKDETRRKIVVGGFVLSEMERSEKVRSWALRGLDERLKRKIDRELFDLGPAREEGSGTGEGER